MASISFSGRVVSIAAGTRITGLKCPATIGIFAMVDLNNLTCVSTLIFFASSFNRLFQYWPAVNTCVCFKLYMLLKPVRRPIHLKAMIKNQLNTMISSFDLINTMMLSGMSFFDDQPRCGIRIP
jgi:hypothetical protein